MRRDTAEAIRDLVLRYGGLLDRSVFWNKDDTDYRRLVGNVLGHLFTNLLLPVFAQYPDLEPPELSSGAALYGGGPGEPRTGRQFQSALVNELEGDLQRIKLLIEGDATIQEKDRARGDLAEVLEHLAALRMFVEVKSPVEGYPGKEDKAGSEEVR